MSLKNVDYKTNIKEMMKDNYREFVKALISIELGIEDESSLEEMYLGFMDNDAVQLIDDWFYSDEIKG